ncbi:MAG TPA: hypothetical protein VH163_04040, partial [Gemmatimonadales bacterium]|nr:hypothetical protein [Gemmatimonadales bacterium]
MRASERWTIMLVPHSSGRSRAWNVSSRMGLGLLSWAGVILLAFAGLGVTAVARGRSVSHNLE